jgi:cellobiose transport system substrate-binding protein
MLTEHKKTAATRALVGLVAVGTMLAGCSSAKSTGGSNASSSSPAAATTSAATGGSSAPAASGPKITLTVGLWGTFGFKEAGLYAAYEKLHPNITIKEDSVEQVSDYVKSLNTHFAAGSGLDDVQGIEIGFVADQVKNQASKWVNFASQPNAGDLKASFYPWKWADATTADGSDTIGLGTDSGPEALCYRTDLFKAAGLPSDRDSVAKAASTWADYIKLGQQYMASKTRPANSAFLDSAASIYSAAIGQGATAYDDAKGNPIYDTNPAVKQAWDYSMEAAQDKITAKLAQWSTQWNQAFANGAFATIACPAWMLGYITSQAGQAVSGDWDVAPLPGGAGNWGGSYLGVPKGGPHEKEAIDFVEWITAPAQQVTMWTSQQHFPSSSTAAKDPAVASATSDYFNKAPIGQIFSDSAAKLTVQPIGPNDSQIGTAITGGITAVEQQGKSPDAAWKAALAAAKQAVSG